MKTVVCLLLLVASLSIHADEWSDWDQLPDDLLGLSGSDDIEQLMDRLDALIKEQAPTADIDNLLDHWLRQTGRSERGRGMALQHLLEQHPHLTEDHPALEVLQDLPGPATDQNRPNRPNKPDPPAGPPSGGPPGPPTGSPPSGPPSGGPPSGPPSGNPGNTNR